jgi:hypothetical protein
MTIATWAAAILALFILVFGLLAVSCLIKEMWERLFK